MSQLKPCRWRSTAPLSPGYWGCASSKLLVPPQGVPEEICQRCYCWDHEPVKPTVKRSTACIHLGDDTGQTTTCPTCAGRVEVKLIGCGIHGSCTIAKEAEGLACCASCPDRKTQLVPRRVVQIDPSRLAKASGHCNCGLAEISGKLWLAYRAGSGGATVHLCELGDDWQPVAGKFHLPIKPLHPRCAAGREDPRLFWHDGKLHCSIIGVEEVMGSDPRTFHTSQLVVRLGNNFRPETTWEPMYEDRMAWEKNWAFFSHDGQMHAVYSIAPHRILKCIDRKAELVHESRMQSPPVSYGLLRGGAPPVRVGDEYYHWFHGALDQPNRKRLYTAGLYTFEAKPPFKITRIARQPLYYPDAAEAPPTMPGHLAGVVFPCGALLRGGQWVVSYGYHDQWCRIAAFDAREVESCLSPVK